MESKSRFLSPINTWKTSSELRADFALEAGQRKRQKVKPSAPKHRFQMFINSHDDSTLTDIASTNKKALDAKMVPRAVVTQNKLVDPTDETEAMDITSPCDFMSEISALGAKSPIIASILKKMRSKIVNKSVSLSDSGSMCESGNVKKTMKKDTPNNMTFNHLIVHHVNRAGPSVVVKCAVVGKKLKARRSTRRKNRTVPILKRPKQRGYKCNQCKKNFRTVKFLEEHITRRHEIIIIVN